MPEDDILAFRARALTPDAPVVRGTAQNPDAFFQGREACNPFYLATPGIVADAMDGVRGAHRPPLRARRVRRCRRTPSGSIVLMGSGIGATAADDGRRWRRPASGSVLLKVRLYRPFPAEEFVAALPP